jgi:hypothetical protein
MKQPTKKPRSLLTFALIGLVAVPLAFVLLSAYTQKEIKILDADVLVRSDSVLGFNADADALHFGSIPRGADGERRIILTNNDSFPKIVKLKARGEVGDWIYFPVNGFVLESGGVLEQVPVRMHIPGDARPGKYAAQVILEIKRKWP